MKYIKYRIIIQRPPWTVNTGANFTNRLRLGQLSLCVRFKPKNRLKFVHEIGPRAGIHERA